MSGMFTAEIRNDNEAQAKAKNWATVLRSGTLQQGHSWLRTPDSKYCCLGVACNAHDPKGWNQVHNSHNDTYEWQYDHQTGSLPDYVQDAFCLSRSDGGYWDSSGNYQTLIHHNDIDIDDFHTIADIIEVELALALA